MRARIMGRLIGLVVIELAIGISWLFGVNRMLVMVAMIGLPILAITVALPIAMLIRSNRVSSQNRPPSKQPRPLRIEAGQYRSACCLSPRADRRSATVQSRRPDGAPDTSGLPL